MWVGYGQIRRRFSLGLLHSCPESGWGLLPALGDAFEESGVENANAKIARAALMRSEGL
jgi:hypothetical protein